MTQSEHLQLLRAYNEVHDELRPKEVPAQEYIETKMGELEDGEIKPELLSSVLAKVEEKDDSYDGAYIQDGAIKVTKGNELHQIALPKNTEELRYRMKLLATTWEMVRIQLPMIAVVQTLTPEDWQTTTHLEYILGEDAMGAEVKSECGTKTYKPSWLNVLELEFQIRKHAFHAVNTKDLDLKTALKDAREDDKLFQRHFLTPVAISAGMNAALASSGGGSPSFATSSSNPLPSSSPLPANFFAQLSTTIAKAVTQAVSAATSGKGGWQNPRAGQGGGGGKPTGKVKGKPKTKGSGKAKAKSKGAGKPGHKKLINDVHFHALQAGKCSRFNKGNCKFFGCPYPHECSVCGSTDCAGIHHPDELGA